MDMNKEQKEKVEEELNKSVRIRVAEMKSRIEKAEREKVEKETCEEQENKTSKSHNSFSR